MWSYTQCLSPIFSKQMIYAQSDQIHQVHVYFIHTSEPHTGCCPPLPHWVGVSLLSIPPSLGWNQACLPLGWYQACLARSRESKSGVQISLWDTCPNTLRSPPPPLSGWMDTTSWKTTKHKTFRSHCHTISHLKQLYHFTSAYTTSHVAIQDTLIKSPAWQSQQYWGRIFVRT